MVFIDFLPPLVLHFLLPLPVELSLDLQNSGPASLLPTITRAALQYFCHLHSDKNDTTKFIFSQQELNPPHKKAKAACINPLRFSGLPTSL